MSEELFTLECTFTGRETDAAIQVACAKYGEIFWIPLSTVHEIHRPAEGVGTGSIVIEAWMAKRKGMI